MEDLDHRMATEVMGWEFIPSRLEQIGEYGVNHYFSAVWKKDGLEILDSKWHPTKNIAQAFMVLSKLEENGWRWQILKWSSEKRKKYKVTLWQKRFMDTDIGIFCTTPAEAICLAVLEAVKVGQSSSPNTP